MKLKQILTISTVVAGLSLSGNWNVDKANAKVNFSVKGLFGTVHGSFTGLEAIIKLMKKIFPEVLFRQVSMQRQ